MKRGNPQRWCFNGRLVDTLHSCCDLETLDNCGLECLICHSRSCCLSGGRQQLQRFLAGLSLLATRAEMLQVFCRSDPARLLADSFSKDTLTELSRAHFPQRNKLLPDFTSSWSAQICRSKLASPRLPSSVDRCGWWEETLLPGGLITQRFLQP